MTRQGLKEFYGQLIWRMQENIKIGRKGTDIFLKLDAITGISFIKCRLLTRIQVKLRDSRVNSRDLPCKLRERRINSRERLRKSREHEVNPRELDRESRELGVDSRDRQADPRERIDHTL